MGSENKPRDWRAGYGVIQHGAETIERVETMLDQLIGLGQLSDRERGRELLRAADRIASQAMWLVAHMTYAQRVYLDGRALAADDFKPHPEDHMGGSFNMAIAYVGYLLANALSGDTRAWEMEQGHCVAAIEAVNVLMGNNSTAMMAAGYPGGASLQYVHMPLPGQKLVALLSDAAFAAQRGHDWAPRWWRGEDCGLVAPIMIANDRRQPLHQSVSTAWLKQHLRLNNFEPIVIDGRDPAAFAWAIVTQERYLEHAARRVAEGKCHYPVPLPYTIAETIKGFGFSGADSNRAHELPLPANPSDDDTARALFNSAAQALWVESAALETAIFTLNNHLDSGRVRERDHALAQVWVETPQTPALTWCRADAIARSPLAALDATFAACVRENPQLRVRVGDLDQLRSNSNDPNNNCFDITLDLLKHRVTVPEESGVEAIDGAVITALNEEAVAAAALGNKQGLNLIVSDEASAAKMLGSVRQEIIFARHCKENARAPAWLSVPLLASSHVWENGKNAPSQQHPTLAEALLGEMSDVSRVLFPVDWNSAIATLLDVYNTHGVIATIVVPKNNLPSLLDEMQACALVQNGIALISGSEQAPVQLLAIGAYQLQQALLAAARLQSRDQDVAVWAVLEPGRFRAPRDSWEAEYCGNASAALPPASYRVLFCHMRPESVLGTLRDWDLGAAHTRALGYSNRGGTLDTFGMLYANRCTWAHGVQALAELRAESLQSYFAAREIAALHGSDDPLVLRCY